jgi:hypothetical protein
VCPHRTAQLPNDEHSIVNATGDWTLYLKQTLLCEVCDANLNATMAFNQDGKSVDVGTTPITVQSSASQIFCSRIPFVLQKTTTDLHIVANFNIVRPNDKYPKLKIYNSELILDRY